jgi:hypothetical protein
MYLFISFRKTTKKSSNAVVTSIVTFQRSVEHGSMGRASAPRAGACRATRIPRLFPLRHHSFSLFMRGKSSHTINRGE